MTTIAYDGNSLSSDSRVTAGERIISDNFTKIFRLDTAEYKGDKLIAIGMAGRTSNVLDIIDYLNECSLPEDHEVNAIIVGNKYVYELEPKSTGLIRYDKKTLLACGSGEPYAITALKLGYSASEAVKIAMKNDIYSGGKINSMYFGKDRK